MKPTHGFTIKEYAERHGVCTRTVRRWIKAGKLPAQYLSKRTIRVLVGVKRVADIGGQERTH